MTTIDLKNNVINRIRQIDDDAVLLDIFALLEGCPTVNEVYQLSGNHKKAIELALKQIQNGECLLHQEAKKEIDEWLNK
jgi:hypothetical protein